MIIWKIPTVLRIFLFYLVCPQHLHKSLILPNFVALKKYDMEMESFLNYESPQVEILEVEVEQGFATSGELSDYEYGGDF